MVWACFTSERLDSLIIYEERGIGKDEYEEILYDGLFSLIDNLLEPPEGPRTIQVMNENIFIFMQDDAPCHKATDVLEFLAENCISITVWPPQSSDLNPIESLWSEFKEHFYKQFLELFNHPLKSLEARYHYGEVMQEV